MTAPPENFRILLVEDAPADQEIFRRTAEEISDLNINLRSCENSRKAETLLADEDYDALFLDHRLPDKDGFSFFRDLKEKDAMVPPAFLISSHGTESLVAQWHRIGGAGYLPKEDLDPEVLEGLLESPEIQESADQFDAHRSQRDPITELHNRRFLINYLEEKTTSSPSNTLTLLLIHVDGLREIRREQGPEAEVNHLKQAGDILRHHVSMHGRCGRYDGDLFWTVLPGISRADATKKGARLLGNLQNVITDNGSGGVSDESNVAGIVAEGAFETNKLIRKIDHCLQRAKAIPGHTVLIHDWEPRYQSADKGRRN